MEQSGSRIDLHMHTTVSDGTDTPEGLLVHIKEAKIRLFAVTDHDAVKAYRILKPLLKEGDPRLISGVEFSCKDEKGKYHILGYGFDPEHPAIREVLLRGHTFRLGKLRARLAFLEKEFGFRFSKEDLDKLFSLDNPGKPHIGNLMVKYRYAKTKEAAIKDFINRVHFKSEYVRPEDAIHGVLSAGGIPVLAHPFYGSGDDLILGEEMEERLSRLKKYGLMGIEAFYSGFSEKLRNDALDLAKKYDLLVTAGSDYHGKNKLVPLGDTGLKDESDYPEELVRFLKRFDA